MLQSVGEWKAMPQSGTGLSGAPAKRPVDAEYLVFWTYAVQKADIADRVALNDGEAAVAGVPRPRSSADGVARVERIGLLGRMIDETIPGNGALAADAIAVHELVEKMQAFRLVQYGRRGERPDYGGAPVQRLEPAWREGPEYDERGLPRRGSFKIAQKRGAGRFEPDYCLLSLVDTTHFVAALRDDWREWWQQLRAIADFFQREPQRLERFIVSGLKAPEFPWLTVAGRSRRDQGAI